VILLPDIRATEPTKTGVSLSLDIPVDLVYFKGHFPAVPLLPGVVQTGWAIELARRCFDQATPPPGAFRSLVAVKFTRVIQPGSVVELRLDFDPSAQRLDFEYLSASGRCSSGTALFTAPP
jgi:3-hydroxymyristoyl/3-hydroxydecanoyl-(acyl carrier protein) dehydratase